MDKMINLKSILDSCNEEITIAYSSCLSNKRFKENTPGVKEKWYEKYLYYRIEKKIFAKYNTQIFSAISEVIEKSIIEHTKNQINLFTNIQEISLGEIAK